MPAVTNGSAHAEAGVRKPPREETAMGELRVCGALYGDLSAADEAFELESDDRMDSLKLLRRMSRLLRSNAAVPTSGDRSN
jgi:hypothetical protein